MVGKSPTLYLSLLTAFGAHAWPNPFDSSKSNSKFGIGTPKECPPVNKGTSAIDYFLLYPEDDDWDAHSRQVIFGFLGNSPVAIYNPYLSQIAQILTFHGVSFTG